MCYRTEEQMTFMANLRNGACRTTAAQDASAIGPLMRDEPGALRWRSERRGKSSQATRQQLYYYPT
jgi:hypothetical protein